MYRLAFKRFLDVAVCTPALLLLSPFFLVVALIVRLDTSGPALFRQERLGKSGRIFTLYKFRTMSHSTRVEPAVSIEIFADNPELTRMGRWLRRLKIDELPQLWNVLRGDMSLVGPRPAMPDQIYKLTDEGRRRLEVRPGLTGLAQVNGNIHLPWEERWRYDRRYVDELSFRLDVGILFKTIAVIALGKETYKDAE